MKNTVWQGLALSMAFWMGSLGIAAAQAPAAPKTIWHFFGIPQAWEASKDANLNRRGNNPERERVPPLKKIADPENLQSPNPAIKTAAKIKADSDLAPQKIKAVKYLGTIACCCPTNKDKIKAALLAALSDCNAGVRQAAAEAICYAAGNPCSVCNTCSCCSADVMNKLAEMAEGKTPAGCWQEPSEAVRTAAANALASCTRVRRPTPAAPGTPTPAGVQPVPHEERVPLAVPPAPIGPPGATGPAASPSRTPVPVVPKHAPTNAKPAANALQHAGESATLVEVVAPQGGASEPAGYAEAVADSREPLLLAPKTTTIPSVKTPQLKTLPISFAPEIQISKP